MRGQGSRVSKWKSSLGFIEIGEGKFPVSGRGGGGEIKWRIGIGVILSPILVGEGS